MSLSSPVLPHPLSPWRRTIARHNAGEQADQHIGVQPQNRASLREKGNKANTLVGPLPVITAWRHPAMARCGITVAEELRREIATYPSEPPRPPASAESTAPVRSQVSGGGIALSPERAERWRPRLCSEDNEGETAWPNTFLCARVRLGGEVTPAAPATESGSTAPRGFKGGQRTNSRGCGEFC